MPFRLDTTVTVLYDNRSDFDKAPFARERHVPATALPADTALR